MTRICIPVAGGDQRVIERVSTGRAPCAACKSLPNGVVPAAVRGSSSPELHGCERAFSPRRHWPSWIAVGLILLIGLLPFRLLWALGMGLGRFARLADALVIPTYARYLPWGGGLSTTISTFPAFLKLIGKAMN